MEQLNTVVNFCDEYLNTQNIKDFERAYNGLQIENSGEISKIGSSVDLNLLTIEQAIKAKVDFLIVHHGMFWNPTTPLVKAQYKKYKLLIENNIAVYSSHLPLDGHPEIGNNVSIAKILNLEVEKFALIDQKFEFKSPVCSTKLSIKELEAELNTIFPDTKSIMFGPVHPKQILICSGAIGHLIYELPKHGIDTLITGEIQQHMFGFAYEHSLNIFACGHYATEIFGVQNLSEIVANKFHLPSTFLPEDCRF